MKKLWVIVSLSLIVMLFVSTSLYAQGLTEKEVIEMEITKRIDSAYQDVIKTHDIAVDNYIKFAERDLGKLFRGESKIQDEKTIERLSTTIVFDLFDYQTIGSVRPHFLIAPDGEEILFVFKEADGNNVVIKATWDEKGELVVNKTSKMGSPILAIQGEE